MKAVQIKAWRVRLSMKAVAPDKPNYRRYCVVVSDTAPLALEIALQDEQWGEVLSVDIEPTDEPVLTATYP
jgi:hypothetical protein